MRLCIYGRWRSRILIHAISCRTCGPRSNGPLPPFFFSIIWPAISRPHFPGTTTATTPPTPPCKNLKKKLFSSFQMRRKHNIHRRPLSNRMTFHVHTSRNQQLPPLCYLPSPIAPIPRSTTTINNGSRSTTTFYHININRQRWLQRAVCWFQII